MPVPTLEGLYEGNDAVTLGALLVGAEVMVKNGGTQIGGGHATEERNWVIVKPPLQSSMSVTASQALCSSGPDSAPYTPVADLPPPTLVPPACPGDSAVRLRDTVINANVILRITRGPSTRVAGYGGAVQGDLVLRLGGGRRLEEGDLLTAVQTIGGIASPLSTAIMVNCSTQNVVTQHNDNRRTGWARHETTLTPTTVESPRFGLLFKRYVQGRIYGQPLYVQGVIVPDGTLRNLVFVGTSENILYAFDADDPNAAAPEIWKRSLLPEFELPVPTTKVGVSKRWGAYKDMKDNIGITGTPVIDLPSATIYVIAKSYRPSDGIAVQRIHALDIATGATRPGWPVVVGASVQGSNESGPAPIQFNPWSQNQRAALLLWRPPRGASGNPVVFAAWGSHGDAPRYHGWLIGYDAMTGARIGVFNTSPNIAELNEWGTEAGGASIWQSGQGPAADDEGHIYVMTGNGAFDPSQGNYGTSILKLTFRRPSPPSPGQGTISVSDSFTPANWKHLNYWDIDLGSGGPLLMPETGTLIGGGKEAWIYSIDTTKMGGLEAREHSTGIWGRGNHVGARHIHGSPVTWNSSANGWLVYVWPENDWLRAFQFDLGTRQLLQGSNDGAFAHSDIDTDCGFLAPVCMPGGMLSISSAGTDAGTGIVWASLPDGRDAVHDDAPGRLIAFAAEPSNGRLRELWRSDKIPGHASARGRQDVASDYVFSKSPAPTIANGKVYLSTFSGHLRVYGLKPDPD
jgi:hypothetical protein